MKMPGKLTRNELRRKIVVVAKKQAHNLDRLIEFINDNAALKNGRLLLVDDEADLASVRFVRPQGQAAIEQGKIAERMDDLRRLVSKIAFLQVTATPYSLYLQPEGYETPARITSSSPRSRPSPSCCQSITATLVAMITSARSTTTTRDRP